LEITPNAGVDIISPGYESGQYPYHTKKFWELYALNAKVGKQFETLKNPTMELSKKKIFRN
jgi:hypothetical protein